MDSKKEIVGARIVFSTDVFQSATEDTPLLEIGGKIYYPEDKVNLLKEEITRLKAELERERELRKELVEWGTAATL